MGWQERANHRKPSHSRKCIKLLPKTIDIRLVFGVFTLFCLILLIYSVFYQTFGGVVHRKYVFSTPSVAFWEGYFHRPRSVPFCSGIINSNKTDIKNALEYMERQSHEEIYNLPTGIFLNLKGNSFCDRFKKARGYFTQPFSETEALFPLAYSILMHKDVEQVERLLRSIYMPQNYYCIHVDKKSATDIHESMANIAECFPNVFIASRLEEVSWGTITMLQADLNCMKDLLRYKDWRYLINLTGQEFPLVSNREIVEDFKILNNTNMIYSHLERKPSFLLRTKFKWKNGRRTGSRKGNAPYNITIAKGNLHNFLTRDFVYYVINNEVPRHFLAWLANTWEPEETFFASLCHNKHLKVPGCHSHRGSPSGPIKFTFRYLVWAASKKYTCAGKFVRQVCIAGVGDVANAVRSPGLFINKLYFDYQPLALDCLEEYQRNKTLKEGLG